MIQLIYMIETQTCFDHWNGQRKNSAYIDSYYVTSDMLY